MNETPDAAAPPAVVISTSGTATLVFTVNHASYAAATVAAHVIAAALAPAALEPSGRHGHSRAAAPYVDRDRAGVPTVRVECGTELQAHELRQRYATDATVDRALVAMRALMAPAAVKPPARRGKS